MNNSPTYSSLLNSQLLFSAWQEIKDKKSAGGIDGISVADFNAVAAQQIQLLSDELIGNNYLPLPYRKVEIPKSEGEKRTLGMLAIRDKILQHAIKQLLEPELEKIFLDVSYAYREGKGALKAIARVKHILQTEKAQWLVSLDLDNFFDTIPHKLLLGKLSKRINDERLMALVELCIKMGKVDKGMQWTDHTEGVPQGAVLSPLLANLYLHELDEWMVMKELCYVRYADDFVILCKEKNKAESALKKTLNLVKQLQLKVNDGYKVEHIQTGFNFLGIHFKGTQISLSEKKQTRLKEKLEQAIYADGFTPAKHFTDYMQGVKNYYAKLLHPQQLLFIDQHLVALLSKNLKCKTQKQAKEKLTNLQFITPEFQKNQSLIIKQIIAATANGGKTLPTVAELVKKRKREYLAIEGEMSELLVTTFGSFIGKNTKGITVKKAGKTLAQAHNNLQHITVMSNGVSISSDAIKFCADNDIAIDFFTHKGEHYSSIHSSVEPDNELWIQQLKAEENGKAAILAKQIVLAKIGNQHKLIKYFHKYHKTTDSTFNVHYAANHQKFKTIETEIKNLATGSLTDLRQQIMAAEGRAAGIYWDAVAELINDDTEFEGRERKGARDLVNSMLNYGYSILYARMWVAVMQARLNPCISCLHTPQQGKPTLVYDLVEFFRQQAVDRVVIALIQKREKLAVKDGLLNEATRNKLVQHIYERMHRYENYRGEQRKLLHIFGLQAKEYAAYLTGAAKNFKPYAAKW
ncbi:MAG: CRISPR-associated endonuclease Cas1 [Chitinophagales bacterium]|nr:CRISPR-associated endonuclease Cas1 [Chitinophagales bacterium]